MFPNNQTCAALGLVLLMIAGMLGGLTQQVTTAEFSDSENSTALFETSSNFNNGNNQGGGNTAFIDYNDNGIQDGDEPDINKNELKQYENRSANLFIPEGVGPITENGNKDLSIVAGNITSRVALTAEKGDIHLEAPDGTVDVTDSELTSNADQGAVQISAGKDILAQGATLSGTKNGVDINTTRSVVLDDTAVEARVDQGNVSITGGSVSAKNADISTIRGSISLTATSGSLIVDDASIEVGGGQGEITLRGKSISAKHSYASTFKAPIAILATEDGGGEMDAFNSTFTVRGDLGGIFLGSHGDMRLDAAALSTNKQATADLGTNDALLNVERLNIQDADGTLTYSPDGVTIDPERNDVEASNSG